MSGSSVNRRRLCFTPMRVTAPVTLQAGSRFLPEDADRIQAALAAAPGAEVEVDLRGVRELHPAALACLARILADHRANVRFRGLTERQARMMRYLGACAPAVAEAAAPHDPE